MLVVDKEVKEMEFFEDDVVVITCEHPLGADNTNVFGRIGVVIDIDKSDGEIYYDVKDTHGDDFLYAASELRDADYEEIAEAFITLVKERI